jgi:hypothetical protein
MPAFVASSSIQPYGRLVLSASSRTTGIVPFASSRANSLAEAAITASPQVGFRAAPFLLLYVGGDGTTTSGTNLGTLVGQGAVLSGDFFVGAVLQAHGPNWRIGLNGRLLHGTGYAIDVDRIALGVSANFIDATLPDAIGEITGANDAIERYWVTSGRLDLVGAYRWKAFTLQGAIGGESIRQDFTPVTNYDLERVLTTAAPRVGVAVGFDPNAWLASTKVWSPVQLLLEYQVTVNRSWLELRDAAPTPSPARLADTVFAAGLYTSGEIGDNVQIGLTVFHESGLANDLITAQQNVSALHPTALGAVLSLHYIF